MSDDVEGVGRREGSLLQEGTRADRKLLMSRAGAKNKGGTDRCVGPCHLLMNEEFVKCGGPGGR